MTLETFYWLLGTFLLWALLALSIMLLAMIGLAATLLRPSAACPDELVGILSEPQQSGMSASEQARTVRCLLVWVLASKTSLDVLAKRLQRTIRILWLAVPAGPLLGLAGWAANQAAQAGSRLAAYPWLEIALGLAIGTEAVALALVISILGRRSLERIRKAVEYLVAVRAEQLQALKNSTSSPTDRLRPTTAVGIGILLWIGLSVTPNAVAEGPASQPFAETQTDGPPLNLPLNTPLNGATSRPTTASAPAEIVIRVDAYGAFYPGTTTQPLAAFQLAEWLAEERKSSPARAVSVVCERKLLDRERQRVLRILAGAKVGAEEITWVEPEAGTMSAPATQPGADRVENARWFALLAHPPVPASQPAAALADTVRPVVILLKELAACTERIRRPPASQPGRQKGPTTEPAHSSTSPSARPHAE